jgi:hypothetical protein
MNRYYVNFDVVAETVEEAVQSFLRTLSDAASKHYEADVLDIDESFQDELYEAEAADRFDRKFDV